MLINKKKSLKDIINSVYLPNDYYGVIYHLSGNINVSYLEYFFCIYDLNDQSNIYYLSDNQSFFIFNSIHPANRLRIFLYLLLRDKRKIIYNERS